MLCKRFSLLQKKISVFLAILLLLAASGPESFAASNLIFHSGFEAGSVGYPSTGESRALLDISGTDNSLPDHNNWVSDLDSYPNIGDFFIQYETSDNSHQRYANIVDDPTNTLFEDNFEDNYSVGDAPHKVSNDKGKRNWTDYLALDATALVQSVPGDSANQAMRVLSTKSTINYPRLDKYIDASSTKRILIQYRVMNMSCNAYLGIALPTASGAPNKDNAISISGSTATAGSLTKTISPNAWTNVLLDVDLLNNRYSATVNGDAFAKDQVLFTTPQTDFTNVRIRFNSGLYQNQYYYFDNVKISKTDVLFSDNFELNYTAGASPRLVQNDMGTSNWSELTAGEASLSVQPDSGNGANKVLNISSSKVGANRPQIAKLLDLSSSQRLTVDYKVKNQGRNTSLELQLPLAASAPERTLVHIVSGAAIAGASSVAVNPDGWTTVSVSCDLYNNFYSVTVNGTVLASRLRLFSEGQTDLRNVRVVFASELGRGDSYCLDDVAIRNTPNKVLKYYGGKVVNDGKLRIQSVVMGNTNAYEYYYKCRLYLNESFEYVKTIGYNLSGYWITLGEFFDGSNWGDNFVYPNYCSRITMGIANPKGASQPLKFNVNLENSLIDKYDWNYTPVWTYDSNLDVPIGKWFTMEVYLKQGLGTDPANGGGKFYMYLTGEDGTRRPVFEINNTTYNPGAVKNGIEHMQPLKFYTKKSLVNDITAKNADIQLYWDDFEMRTTLPEPGEEIAVPAAPDISADDINNTLTGLNLQTMEYALSTNGGRAFGAYTSSGPIPDLGGSKMLKVRTKAAGGSPAGMDALAVFTPDQGDVNGDGITDIADVVIAGEVAVGSENHTSDEARRANVNSNADYKVDISDIIMIAERAVGETAPFPVDLP